MEYSNFITQSNSRVSASLHIPEPGTFTGPTLNAERDGMLYRTCFRNSFKRTGGVGLGNKYKNEMPITGEQ